MRGWSKVRHGRKRDHLILFVRKAREEYHLEISMLFVQYTLKKTGRTERRNFKWWAKDHDEERSFWLSRKACMPSRRDN